MLTFTVTPGPGDMNGFGRIIERNTAQMATVEQLSVWLPYGRTVQEASLTVERYVSMRLLKEEEAGNWLRGADLQSALASDSLHAKSQPVVRSISSMSESAFKRFL